MTAFYQQALYPVASSPFATKAAPPETGLSLVKQRSPSDCGICCAAMLLDLSYEEAYDLCWPYTNRPRDAIDFDKLPALFARAGKKVQIFTQDPQAFTHDGLCEITYRRHGVQQWHYIVWDSDTNAFLDPQNNPPHHFLIHRFLALDTPAPHLRTLYH